MKYKYTKENLEPIVNSSSCFSDVLIKLNLHHSGGNHNNLKNAIERLGIDISHFDQRYKRCKESNKKHHSEILIFDNKLKHRRTGKRLKKALSEIGVPDVCFKCGNNGKWMGDSIILEVDHIDGNWRNNTSENLRILCPNCHSQTQNYYNLKKKFYFCSCGRQKYRYSKNCMKCASVIRNQKAKKRRKCERPPDDVLQSQVSELGYSATGRIYGVSDNAIRKWLSRPT